MSFLVSMLGLIMAVAGIVGFVFGLSIKEFSFGGTLMVTGAIALIGGLLLVAMAAAIRELHRIGTVLVSRQPSRFARPGDAHDPYAAGFAHPAPTPPQMVPVPVPPVPVQDAPPVARHDEPQREATPDPAAALEAALSRAGFARETIAEDLDRAAPRDAETGAETPSDVTAQAEPEPHPFKHPSDEDPSDVHPIPERASESPVELREPEDIPLSPHGTLREEPFDTYIRAAKRDEDHAAEPDVTAERPDTATEPEPEHAETPPRERRRFPSFDAIWPPSGGSSTRRSVEPEPQPEPEHAQGEDRDIDAPAAEAPRIAPEEEPEPSWLRNRDDVARAEPAEAEAASDKDEPPHAVAILKSGVVDGMGYALYSDGSIEAALPTGTVRFASINELRDHLEKAQ